jgi:hypothetical protein
VVGRRKICQIILGVGLGLGLSFGGRKVRERESRRLDYLVVE